jgi:hypothetical protein
MTRLSRLAPIVFAALTAFAPVSASAQQIHDVYHQVVSANPFGMLFGLFNAEFERRVSPSATVGAGGSTFKDEADDYVNADAFYRYYPSGRPFDGWAFGVKAGATSVGSGTFFGYGFDVNWSRLMGAGDKVYMGWGFGLKRLVGADEYTQFIPTIRIVNLGVAF